LPEPLNPVITVRLLRGILTSTFFRLCCRAPWTVICLSILREMRNCAGAHSVLDSTYYEMRKCAHCGGGMSRSPRRFWERPLFDSAFECRRCEARTRSKRVLIGSVGTHARCPRCGTEEIRKRSSPDRIDRVLRTPLSLLQSLIGGSLYHCMFCRLQFYDVRRRRAIRVSAPIGQRRG